MPPLPVVSGRELITALSKIGYTQARQRGSHVRLTAPGRTPITVPLHPALDRGTLRAILRTVDLTASGFIDLLS